MHGKAPTDEMLPPVGRWPISLALFATAAVAVLWRSALAWRGVDLFSDDAYYYAVTARNFVETGRITFDGTSLTSGFHPLMFWLEAAGYAVFGTGASPMGQYLGILAGVMTVFLLTVGGCLLWVHGRPQSEDEAAIRASLLVTVCAVLVPRFTAPYLGGMEAVLVLPLLILFGLLAWHGRYVAAAAAALFLVMARLDALPYVVFPVAVACGWRERSWRRPAILRSLLIAGPATVGTLALMLFNRLYFGHPMPIHGVLKSCFPRIHFQWHQVFGLSRDSITLPLVFLAAMVSVVLLLRDGKSGKAVRAAGITSAVLALTQLAAFMLFQKWSKPIPPWYVGPAVLTAAFASAMAVANTLALRRLRTLAAVAVVAVVAVNLASIARAWHRGLPAPAAHGASDLIDFMKAQPGDRIWACTDCGKLAFWSGRRVVNLDGLVNDFRFQQALREQRLGQYLLERNVKYLVFLAWDRPQVQRGPYEPMYESRVAPDVFAGDYQAAEFYLYSYQYMTYSNRLRLPRAAEVWRSAASPDGRAMGRAVVFDLPQALAEGP